MTSIASGWKCCLIASGEKYDSTQKMSCFAASNLNSATNKMCLCNMNCLWNTNRLKFNFISHLDFSLLLVRFAKVTVEN